MSQSCQSWSNHSEQLSVTGQKVASFDLFLINMFILVFKFSFVCDCEFVLILVFVGKMGDHDYHDHVTMIIMII